MSRGIQHCYLKSFVLVIGCDQQLFMTAAVCRLFSLQKNTRQRKPRSNRRHTWHGLRDLVSFAFIPVMSCRLLESLMLSWELGRGSMIDRLGARPLLAGGFVMAGLQARSL